MRVENRVRWWGGRAYERVCESFGEKHVLQSCDFILMFI